MQVFLLTFGMLMLVVAAMAIGYLVQRKKISGSCGGIASLGIDKVCDCPEPCEKRRKREAKEARRQEMLEKHRII
ncbi:(Na+)-NQR maturation NqrM [Corallincola platygyrae]|uniref:(Na+)-NQR maturation NqrM n=1 Tax=Corallincola platygyrae TaxID=1193278 RepID=A0ABW4XJJ9_9GAMM